MKRKMIGAAAAYMSGLFFASFFTEGSDFLLLAGLFPVFFAAAKLLKIKISDVIIISVSFVTAFTVHQLYTHLVFGRITAFEGTTGSFSGEITEVTFYDKDTARYIVDGKINGKQPAEITFFTDAYNVQYGDVIFLENCEFKIPEDDYLFESSSYYKSQGIYLTAENAEIVRITHTDSGKLVRRISEYREKIISEFMIKLGDESGGFLSGIVFGENSDIEDSSEALLYRCGIGHVIAVSGLHISILAALLMTLLQKLRINKYLSYIILILFLVLMIIMVRYPVSAIRAAIMLLIMYSARLFRRQNDTLNSLAAAALIICIVNPYSLLDRGFMLSVSGTFGIGVFGPYMTRNMKRETLVQKLIIGFSTMLCVMIAIFPLNIIYFDETSVISPVTNLIAVPFCVGALVTGMLYVLSGGLISLLSIAKLLTAFVLWITDVLGNTGIAHISCGDDNMQVVILLCTILVTAIHFVLRNRRMTAVTIAGSMLIFFSCSVVSERIKYDSFRIAVLGRNTNAAIAVTYHGVTDIYDLSGHYKSSQYIRKYLAANGISEVNMLMLSKNVQAQYSAYSESLELYKPYEFLISGDTEIGEAKKNAAYFGESEVTFQNTDYTAEYIDGTLLIEYDGKTIMFTHAKNAYANGNINIYYGNITKNIVPVCNGYNIYLDETKDIMYNYSDMNNFEIILTAGSNDMVVRRMQNGSD